MQREGHHIVTAATKDALPGPFGIRHVCSLDGKRKTKSSLESMVSHPSDKFDLLLKEIHYVRFCNDSLWIFPLTP